MQMERPKEAAKIYQDLTRRYPTRIRYFKAWAQAETAAGRYDRAIDALETGWRICGPTGRDIDRLQADLYLQKSMYREAASCYCRMVSSDSEPVAEDYYRLGYCYYQCRQWSSARQTLGKALQLDVFSVIDKPVDMDILRQQLNRLFIKRYNSDVFEQ